MAVRLRLRRIGKKKTPLYQIVAADSRAARDGKFLEIIGRYEPLKNPMLIETNDQRIFYWLKSGALPTDTVRSLLQRSGLWLRWSLTKKGADAGVIAKHVEKWQMEQVEKRVRDDARKQRRVVARRKAKQAGATAVAPAAAAPAQA